jgi:hypothetical protein
MNKLLKFAEIMDAFRLFPRGLIILYGFMTYQVTMWFMGLPDPNAAQSTFVSIVWGASAGWFGLYVNSGRNWKE